MPLVPDEVRVITADTITDEQIRELLRNLERDANTAHFALLREPFTAALKVERYKARARCADLINARGDK